MLVKKPLPVGGGFFDLVLGNYNFQASIQFWATKYKIKYRGRYGFVDLITGYIKR